MSTMTICAESNERRAKSIAARYPTIATGALAFDAERAAEIVWQIEKRYRADPKQYERHIARMEKCIEFGERAYSKAFELCKREHGVKHALWCADHIPRSAVN